MIKVGPGVADTDTSVPGAHTPLKGLEQVAKEVNDIIT